jgi:hypothetical protein
MWIKCEHETFHPYLFLELLCPRFKNCLIGKNSQIDNCNYSYKNQYFNYKCHVQFKNLAICLDKWYNTTICKRHHMISTWHLVIIVFTYLLGLKVKFSYIILNNHPFDVTLGNCKIMQLPCFIITYMITICQTKWCTCGPIYMHGQLWYNYVAFYNNGGGGVFHLNFTHLCWLV